MTQNTNVNAEPFDMEKSVRLSVTNETLFPFAGRVRWALRDAGARIIREGEMEATTEPLSAVWLEKLDFADAEPFGHYVSFELVSGGREVSSGTVLFCPPKHFAFDDPGLIVTVSGNAVTVKASAYARSVEIYSEDGDLKLEDNFFDMNAGERTVRVMCGSADGLKARSVYDIR